MPVQRRYQRLFFLNNHGNFCDMKLLRALYNPEMGKPLDRKRPPGPGLRRDPQAERMDSLGEQGRGRTAASGGVPGAWRGWRDKQTGHPPSGHSGPGTGQQEEAERRGPGGREETRGSGGSPSALSRGSGTGAMQGAAVTCPRPGGQHPCPSLHGLRLCVP